MSAGWDQMIVAATLDDVPNSSAIYFQVGGKVQPKLAALITIKRPLAEPSVAKRDSGEEDRMRRNLPMRVKVLMEFSYTKAYATTCLNAPQRAGRAELGNFA